MTPLNILNIWINPTEFASKTKFNVSERPIIKFMINKYFKTGIELQKAKEDCKVTKSEK